MPRFVAYSAPTAYRPDPALDRILRRTVLVGITLVLLLPLARGHSQWLGWGPLWLVGMPLVAWWALHRFRLPRLPWQAAEALGRMGPRRRLRAQARRRSAASPRPLARAA